MYKIYVHTSILPAYILITHVLFICVWIQALLEQHGGLPWYGYAAIGGAILLGGRTLAKIATDTVKSIQAEEEREMELKNITTGSGGSGGSGADTGSGGDVNKGIL